MTVKDLEMGRLFWIIQGLDLVLGWIRNLSKHEPASKPASCVPSQFPLQTPAGLPALTSLIGGL